MWISHHPPPTSLLHSTTRTAQPNRRIGAPIEEKIKLEKQNILLLTDNCLTQRNFSISYVFGRSLGMHCNELLTVPLLKSAQRDLWQTTCHGSNPGMEKLLNWVWRFGESWSRVSSWKFEESLSQNSLSRFRESWSQVSSWRFGELWSQVSEAHEDLGHHITGVLMKI